MAEQPLIDQIIGLESRAQRIRELASSHERDARELRKLSEELERDAREVRELVSHAGQPEHPGE